MGTSGNSLGRAGNLFYSENKKGKQVFFLYCRMVPSYSEKVKDKKESTLKKKT